MLPKPEKNSKRISSQQLDLVETISDADKIKKKRLSLFIFLLLTIGLSLSFWAFRQFKNFSFSQIKLTLPAFSLPVPSASFVPKVPESWSIYISTIGTTDFTYSQNFDSQVKFDQIEKTNPSPYAKKYLPEGVVAVEKLHFNPDYLEILSQISVPNLQFQVYTRIPGQINSDSSDLDSFSQMVESLYWYLLQ